MGENSKIEWTDATWNPVRGCSRVSPGCGGPGKVGGCYAEKIAARFSDPGQPFHGFAERTRDGGRWTGEVSLVDGALDLPLRWRKPRRIFVNSMSDLFHEALPDDAIDQVFAVMAKAERHTFQVLTKRADRMRAYVSRIAQEAPRAWPLPNVWLGVSVEDQARADERIPLLLDTPAAVRFLSCEPLLGAVDLTTSVVRWAEDELRRRIVEKKPRHDRDGKIDWVICGGESGPRARPMHPDWPRSLRDQCAAAGVAFFFKQWGEWFPGALADDGAKLIAEPDIDHDPTADSWEFRFARYQTVGEAGMLRVGKKRAGRRLDGREHNEFPELAHA